jgi:nucleoside-diphosphate-sugar epimerase
MHRIILVAGATGNLGGQIVQYLIAKGTEVRVIVRASSDKEKVKKLEQLGAKVFIVDMLNVEEVTAACIDVHCVVSALSGLEEVILVTQKVLLDAAIAAKVRRFIPSDYSLDFTKFNEGENRNLDWRRKFHKYLDTDDIDASSIFNGAFMDMLTGQMPMIFFKRKRILYWGNADHKLQFTTVADTAKFTANVALDPSTPRYLHIAGDYVSPREIQKIMSDIEGKPYSMFRPGGLKLLSTIIKIARFMAPGKKELYPAFQGMQYMRNMIDERGKLDIYSNNRYDNMQWTKVQDLLTAHLKTIDDTIKK